MKNRIQSKLYHNAGKVTLARPGHARFRRLKAHERVWIGDYVKSPVGGYQPWDGPGGFSADTFARPVYRLKRGG